MFVVDNSHPEAQILVRQYVVRPVSQPLVTQATCRYVVPFDRLVCGALVNVFSLCTSSIETPTPWVLGKGRGFDIDPGQKASISLHPEARVQIKRPYPESRKMKISKVSRKKDMWLNGEIFQVYMYKYAALIKLLLQ